MNSTVPSGLTKIDAGMLGAARLAQVVLAGPLVLDGGAQLPLKVARQGVAARTRVPLNGDLHRGRRVDVDQDRGTWHRGLLAWRGGLLDHQLDVTVLLDPLQHAPAGTLDRANRGVDGVDLLEAVEVGDVAPASLVVVHAHGLGRLDDDRVLPTGQLDQVAGVRLLVVERHAAMLEREPELAAGIGESLAVPEVNLNGRGVTQRWISFSRAITDSAACCLRGAVTLVGSCSSEGTGRSSGRLLREQLALGAEALCLVGVLRAAQQKLDLLLELGVAQLLGLRDAE